MFTYNVRTPRTEDCLDRLTDEADQIKWDVTGMCEIDRKGEGLSKIKGGCWVYEIGKTEDNPDAKGLALLIHPKLRYCLRNVQAE